LQTVTFTFQWRNQKACSVAPQITTITFILHTSFQAANSRLIQDMVAD